MNQTSYKLPEPLVTASPEWLGGEPCFAGRRVPVRALFDYLKVGHSLDDFLADYPSVSREHAKAVIEAAGRSLASPSVAAE